MIDHSVSVSSYRRRDIKPPSQWKASITPKPKPQGRLLVYGLVLQALYNPSDDQAEFQIRDRLSFMRFLGADAQRAEP